MIRYLLDTNIVSEPARKQPDARVIKHYQAHGREMAIPSIVWHELIYGLERLSRGRKRDYLRGYLSRVVQPSLPILPYDEQAARWHGQARARLERRGRSRPFADGMIAAVAATRGLILVTRNTSDFTGFKGLHVENWFAKDPS